MGRVGFVIREVCRAIRLAVGSDQRYGAVLIGTGRLGGALLAHSSDELMESRNSARRRGIPWVATVAWEKRWPDASHKRLTDGALRQFPPIWRVWHVHCW